MNEFFWELYQQGRIQSVESQSNRALSGTERLERQIRQLEATVEKLKLINIALAELLIEKGGTTEESLINKIREVDLRDGIQDGRVGSTVQICPQCHRRYNPSKNKCLYCGFSGSESTTILDKVN